jgi:nucleoside-triphosphatase THEP1
MIYIITGEINQGKTRRMISIYRQQQTKQGDGFASKKIFPDGADFTGYEIVRLSNNEKMPLAYRSQHVPPGWDEIYRRGPFHFSKAAFAFAEAISDDIIARDINPVFIDEIGPLELEGKGFAPLLEKILTTGKDVYITVRNHCVEEVLRKFNIREHELIKFKNGSTDYTD